MIELYGLSKKFGNFYAVRDLSLRVPAGEVFGFLGPNGAGKTTTLRLMAGLIHPTSGRVLLGGKDIHTQPEEAKALLGFIPDRPFLYDKLTGREFLEFIADLHDMDSGLPRRRISELLDLFLLRGWGDELVEGYSHGMRQRLAFAAALIHQPQVLVVDEPMVGLDPKGARLVKSLFRELSRSGVAVFLSTHNLEVAEEVCQRIGIIHEGRLIAEGTMAQLRARAKREDERLESLFLRLTGEVDGDPP